MSCPVWVEGGQQGVRLNLSRAQVQRARLVSPKLSAACAILRHMNPVERFVSQLISQRVAFGSKP